MPTHFSKLEGSPSNMQRERRRRRRELATAATKLPPAVGFDESVGSTVTACEGNVRKNNHMNMNRINNNNNNNNNNNRINNNFDVGNSFRRAPSAVAIPQFINVENSKRLQQGHRPPQYDAYCQSRVSAIASLGHSNDAGSSNVSSLSSPRSRGKTTDAEDRYGFPPSRERRRLPTVPSRRNRTDGKPSSPRSAPSELSGLTTTSSSRNRHRKRSPIRPRMHPLVNAHGVFGSEGNRTSNGNRNSNRKTNHRSKDNVRRRKSHTTDPLVSSRRRKAKTALESVRHLEDSITEAYGNPYSRGAPSNSRRRTNAMVLDHDVENDSFDESRNDATLMGERFADDSSEFDELRIGNDRSNSSHQQKHQQHHQHAGTKWLCDVCKEARFDTYVEAYRHENECRKRHNNTLGKSRTKESKELQYNRGDDHVNVESNSGRNGIHDVFYKNNKNNSHQYREQHLRNQLQDMSLSSSSCSQPSSHCTFATNPIASKLVYNNNNHKNDSKEATRWLCSVCKKVSFDHYQDACCHEKICRIRMKATADLRGATAETPKEASAPPLHFDLTQYHDGNLYNPETNNHPPEGRQDESTRPTITPQTQYTSIGAIEREREGGDMRHSPMHPSSIGRARNEKNNIVRQQDFQFLAGEIQTRNPKGEAYDRYVSLASQQEEEEERERLIALAKQTREEELISFRQEDDDEERYVCLA